MVRLSDCRGQIADWRERSHATSNDLDADDRGVGGQATADGTTAWFGTPLPPPLSDPRKPIMKYDDVFAPLPAQFAHRPGKSDELLDAAALKADQKRIVGFSLESLDAGDKVWGRRAGTPAFMHTIEWTVDAFRTAGLKDAKVETYPVPARCGCRSRGACRSWATRRSALVRRP